MISGGVVDLPCEIFALRKALKVISQCQWAASDFQRFFCLLFSSLKKVSHIGEDIIIKHHLDERVIAKVAEGFEVF